MKTALPVQLEMVLTLVSEVTSLVMDKIQALATYVWELLRDDWALLLIGAICGPVLRYLYLWGMGKSKTIVPKQRIRFFATTAVLVAVILLVCIGALNSIKNAVNPLGSGGLRASVLHAGPSASETAAMPEITTNINEFVGTPSSAMVKLEKGFDMTFILRVVNSGSPTVAWNWDSYVMLPDGQRIAGYMPSIAAVKQGSPTPTPVGMYTMTLDKHLLQSLALKPLDTGAGINGWLVVHVNGMDKPPYGAIFVISFSDAFGRVTKIEHKWTPSQ